MPEPKPQRQMIDMDVFETSGVDHPAHGHEGWLVMKSAGPGRVSRLKSILEGKTMPQSKEALLKEVDASKLAEPVKEYVRKSIDLTDDINTVAELFQSLRAKQEADDPEIPSTTTDAAAPAAVAAVPAPVAAAAMPGAEVFKALDAGAQAELAKAVKDNPGLAKALDALAKQGADAMQKARDEENKRLDAEAIQKSRETFKHVAIDHDEVAPALRKMSVVDPDGYATVIDTLTKAEGQLEAAAMFSEIGTARTATTGSAMQKARGVASSLVEAGTVKTIAEGLTKAFEADPNLYAEYEKESANGR